MKRFFSNKYLKLSFFIIIFVLMLLQLNYNSVNAANPYVFNITKVDSGIQRYTIYDNGNKIYNVFCGRYNKHLQTNNQLTYAESYYTQIDNKDYKNNKIQIQYLLDHIYLPWEDSSKEEKDFYKNSVLKAIYPDVVKMSDTDIWTAEQYAIWHYTDGDQLDKNIDEKVYLNQGLRRNLYDALIKYADEAAKNGYKSANENDKKFATELVKIEKTENTQMVVESKKIKVGPFKISGDSNQIYKDMKVTLDGTLLGTATSSVNYKYKITGATEHFDNDYARTSNLSDGEFYIEIEALGTTTISLVKQHSININIMAQNTWGTYATFWKNKNTNNQDLISINRKIDNHKWNLQVETEGEEAVIGIRVNKVDEKGERLPTSTYLNIQGKELEYKDGKIVTSNTDNDISSFYDNENNILWVTTNENDIKSAVLSITEKDVDGYINALKNKRLKTSISVNENTGKLSYSSYLYDTSNGNENIIRAGQSLNYEDGIKVQKSYIDSVVNNNEGNYLVVDVTIVNRIKKTPKLVIKKKTSAESLSVKGTTFQVKQAKNLEVMLGVQDGEVVSYDDIVIDENGNGVVTLDKWKDGESIYITETQNAPGLRNAFLNEGRTIYDLITPRLNETTGEMTLVKYMGYLLGREGDLSYTYTRDNSVYTNIEEATISEDNDSFVITVNVNDPPEEKQINVKVIKKDMNNNEITGGKFNLYSGESVSEDNEIYSSLVKSMQAGETYSFTALRGSSVDAFYLKEVEAPDGYINALDGNYYLKAKVKVGVDGSVTLESDAEKYIWKSNDSGVYELCDENTDQYVEKLYKEYTENIKIETIDGVPTIIFTIKDPEEYADLSLRKFITEVKDGATGEEEEITTRIPDVDISPLVDKTGTTAKYEHTKEPVLVHTTDIVTYTIRVYNEGNIDCYASLIKDDIPQGLEFVPYTEGDGSVNATYGWKLVDENDNEVEDISKAKYIVTNYLAKDEEGKNLIKAFDPDTMTELDYRDVKVQFKVLMSNTSDKIITNYAQISEETNSKGEKVKDRDSTPNEWKNEDDEDVEHIKVLYFDLALRKWVTQAIVTENGKTTVVETGHKAEDDPEEVVKVDLKKSKLNDVTVKFRYSIRITNEGKIAGEATEISDYIPSGLKFVQEDNPDWREEDGKVVTNKLAGTTLKPGESAEVEILLTWVNSESNMGVMINTAEISKDHNNYGTPDIDSTPNNKVPGEDDIDDAPVMLTIKTGSEIIAYASLMLGFIAIIAVGINIIKNKVL